jgi:hypothetical protein
MLLSALALWRRGPRGWRVSPRSSP